MGCNRNRYPVHKYSRPGRKKQVGFRIFLLFLRKNLKASGANHPIFYQKQSSKREVRTLYAISIQKNLILSLKMSAAAAIIKYPKEMRS